MPIDYNKYPPDWEQTRERILIRAGNKCEECRVDNYAMGYRDKQGAFHEMTAMEVEAAALDGDKVLQIVLTIAHLDHDEENHNVKDERLKALCQRCHLIYDIPEKRRRAKKKKAIKDLFE